MQREILEPRWENIDKKEIIITTFRYTLEDGSTRDVKASISNATQPDGADNPDWVEVIETFGEDVITQNTQKRLDSIRENDERRDAEHLARKERKLEEELFNLKLQFFNNDLVSDIDDIASKRNIRRAEDIPSALLETMEALIKDAMQRANMEYVSPPSKVEKETANTETETANT